MATRKTGNRGSDRTAGTPAKPPKTGRGASTGGAGQGDDLQRALRDFASARPQGWNHDDWIALLDHLREKGHDTSNAEGIGQALEKERLAVVLEQISGVGPRRVRAITENFDGLWNLRQADVEEISRRAGLPRAVAQKVHDAVR